MENSNFYRVYDEKMDLLYETRVRKDEKTKDSKLFDLLDKSKLFLNIDNIQCYRIVPELK
ncbi:MAG: hypothetical protein AAFN93_00505 [Bacteroidota bacterium]